MKKKLSRSQARKTLISSNQKGASFFVEEDGVVYLNFSGTSLDLMNSLPEPYINYMSQFPSLSERMCRLLTRNKSLSRPEVLAANHEQKAPLDLNTFRHNYDLVGFLNILNINGVQMIKKSAKFTSERVEMILTSNGNGYLSLRNSEGVVSVEPNGSVIYNDNQESHFDHGYALVFRKES